jgi:hypothetical protein
MQACDKDRQAQSNSMIRFFAHFLFILAAWTLTIKYIFPVGYALNQQLPLGTYILWDFWWVIHIWLGWSLLHWQRYTYQFALGVSVVEIAIVVTKFVLFLSAPEWTIWRTNWFVNKVFVLACFLMLFTYLMLNSRELKQRGKQGSERAMLPGNATSIR